MKIKIAIKSWLNDSILFEFEKEENTLKDTLIEAVKSHANLFRANLSRANLSRADLDIWWHVHHETLWEVLTERIANRINYIKNEKAKEESKEKIKLRLKLLKPVLGEFPKDQKGWDELHKKECGCKFKTTIFDNL